MMQSHGDKIAQFNDPRERRYRRSAASVKHQHSQLYRVSTNLYPWSLVKNIDTIKLDQPSTLNPQIYARAKIQIESINEIIDITKPNPTANFSGRSEKDKIMSKAKLTRFLRV